MSVQGLQGLPFNPFMHVRAQAHDGDNDKPCTTLHTSVCLRRCRACHRPIGQTNNPEQHQ